MKKALPALFALLLLTGCNSIFTRGPMMYDGYEQDAISDYSSTTTAEAPSYDKSMAMEFAVNEASESVAEESKVIKTGTLSLHVDNVNEATDAISTLVLAKQGTVVSSSVFRGEKSYSGYMMIRVPAEQFEASMDELKGLARFVISEDSNASDVTDYYVDMEARLKNKQAEEAQYLEILKDASNVTDTLAVTQALNNVRYEIESLQGQLKSYDTQIDYSSISVNLSEDESVEAASETWSPVSTVRGAQSDFVVFLQDVVDAVIYIVIFAWPLLLVLAVVWVVRRSRRSKR